MEQLIQRGYSEDQIVKATGLKKNQVRARMRLTNLTQPLREAMMEGKITPTNAEEAAKLGTTAQTRLAQKLEEKDKLTWSDVDEVRRARHDQAVTTTLSALDFSGVASIEEVEKAEKQERDKLRRGADYLRRLLDWQEFRDGDNREALEAVIALVEREVERS